MRRRFAALLAAVALGAPGLPPVLRAAEAPNAVPPPPLAAPGTPDPAFRQMARWIVRPEWKQMTEAERRNDLAAIESLVTLHPGLAKARALTSLEPLINWVASQDATHLLSILLSQGALHWQRRDDLPRRPSPLSAAIRAGKTNAAALLLRAGADPNALDDDTRLPPVARLVSHWEALKLASPPDDSERTGRALALLLLQAGANLLQATPDDPHPLLRPRRDAIPYPAHEFLLTNALPSAQRHAGGLTLLHAAVTLGATNALPVLLARGLDANATNRFGDTPLHTVAACLPEPLSGSPYDSFDPEWLQRHADPRLPAGIRETLVRQLLAGGARHDVFTAAALGELPALSSLIHARPNRVNVRDTRGRTPLHWAVLGDHVSSVRALIPLGADLAAADEDGLTPLHLSLVAWRKESTRLLLEARAPLDRVDRSGRTPLALATHAPEAVDLLLSHGAHPNGPGTRPPLLEAVRHLVTQPLAHQNPPSMFRATQALDFREAPVRALLRAGADPLAAGPDGLSTLDLALTQGALNLTELLVDHGVDLNRRDAAGQPAWFAALQGPPIVAYHPPVSWQLRLVRHLPDWLATPMTRRGWMPSWPPMLRVPVLPALARYGAQLTATNAQGENALHRLASRAPRHLFDLGPTNTIPFLLESGLRIDARDRLGFTPWLRAWRSGTFHFALALSQSGADPRATNVAGDHALHLAVQFIAENPRHPNSTTLSTYLPILRDLGVDPRRDNATGTNAIRLARAAGLHPIADQLEQWPAAALHPATHSPPPVRTP